MSKHTPGPWDTFAQAVFTDKNGFLCSPSAAGDKSADLEEVFANAQLIAAAPDLLAALRGLLDPATNEDGEWYRQAQDAARAAIDKATGGAA